MAADPLPVAFCLPPDPSLSLRGSLTVESFPGLRHIECYPVTVTHQQLLNKEFIVFQTHSVIDTLGQETLPVTLALNFAVLTDCSAVSNLLTNIIIL